MPIHINFPADVKHARLPSRDFHPRVANLVCNRGRRVGVYGGISAGEAGAVRDALGLAWGEGDLGKRRGLVTICDEGVIHRPEHDEDGGGALIGERIDVGTTGAGEDEAVGRGWEDAEIVWGCSSSCGRAGGVRWVD